MLHRSLPFYRGGKQVSEKPCNSPKFLSPYPAEAESDALFGNSDPVLSSLQCIQEVNLPSDTAWDTASTTACYHYCSLINLLLHNLWVEHRIFLWRRSREVSLLASKHPEMSCRRRKSGLPWISPSPGSQWSFVVENSVSGVRLC